MKFCICLFAILAVAYSNSSLDQECLQNRKYIIPIVVDIETNISSMELDEIPPNFFAQAEKLERLVASHNRLNVVTKSQFARATNLLAVDFSFNKITEIERGAFINGSGRIKSLDFSNNDIREIPYDTFNGLKNLEYINFSRNKLKEVAARRHPAMNSVKVADFSFNGILAVNILPTDDGCLNMEILDVSNNKIEHVAPLSKLTKLKHLNLSHNQLEAFEIETFLHLTNLVTLDLSFNKFKMIDISLLLHSISIEVIFVENNPCQQIIGYEYCLTPHLRILPSNATTHLRLDQAIEPVCSFSSNNSAAY